ncbi:hypothetical protein PX554_19825 [Sphingomonas sp. H39-1-10]|uniref:hypothetical protein n=1 Tax=Sphingomonas pollutisoli TaxID=3030829 RepID=UPI0023B88BCC|nr:hypothetical protein [Sphingomonas pollutisoli]MDF0490381.1 hypothetical protein [Sphingomonas pollutisoli]
MATLLLLLRLLSTLWLVITVGQNGARADSGAFGFPAWLVAASLLGGLVVTLALIWEAPIRKWCAGAAERDRAEFLDDRRGG